MTKTEHYQLNQWDAGDRVLREDFNADNRKIEEALSSKGNCHIVTGSYIGTGTYGKDNPMSLTFPFPPKVVILRRYLDWTAPAMFWQGEVSELNFVYDGSHSSILQPSWSEDGKTLSWYNSGNGYAPGQLNDSRPYFFLALG